MTSAENTSLIVTLDGSHLLPCVCFDGGGGVTRNVGIRLEHLTKVLHGHIELSKLAPKERIS